MSRRLGVTLSVASIVATIAGIWFAFAPDPVGYDFHPGIPDDHDMVAAAVAENYPASFQDASGLTEEQSAANATKNVRLWVTPSGARLNLNPGRQQIGDCPSWAGAHALNVCLFQQTGGSETREVSTLFLYGLCRVTIGKHKPPCGRDGGYPTYVSTGIEQRGFLFVGEAGLPEYSGQAARKAGCNGPTAEQLQLAQTRRGGSTQPLNDIKAIRNAICAGYPVTMGFQWKPGRPYVTDGKRYMPFNGPNLKGHAVCLIGYDGSNGRPSWYMMNQHGADFAGGVLGDEPPGGVWIDENWMNQIVDTGGEFWAISALPGFDPVLNWDAFDAAAPNN